MSLRAQMLAIPRRPDQLSLITSWLAEHLPEVPVAIMFVGPDRAYFVYPIKDSGITAAPPVGDFDVLVFDDPAVGMQWVNDDIALRRLAPVGRPC